MVLMWTLLCIESAPFLQIPRAVGALRSLCLRGAVVRLVRVMARGAVGGIYRLCLLQLHRFPATLHLLVQSNLRRMKRFLGDLHACEGHPCAMVWLAGEFYRHCEHEDRSSQDGADVAPAFKPIRGLASMCLLASDNGANHSPSETQASLATVWTHLGFNVVVTALALMGSPVPLL